MVRFWSRGPQKVKIWEFLAKKSQFFKLPTYFRLTTGNANNTNNQLSGTGAISS